MPTQYITGLGGYGTFQPTSPSAGSTVRFEVTKWTVRSTSRLAENTHSGTTATNFEPVVPHHEWDVEGGLDINNYWDFDAGMEEGTKGTLTFYEGTDPTTGLAAGTVVLTNTTVESVVEVDDNSQDIIRLAAAGKGGVKTRT